MLSNQPIIKISFSSNWDKTGTHYSKCISMDEKTFDQIQDMWRTYTVINNITGQQQSFENQGKSFYLTITQANFVVSKLAKIFENNEKVLNRLRIKLICNTMLKIK